MESKNHTCPLVIIFSTSHKSYPSHFVVEIYYKFQAYFSFSFPFLLKTFGILITLVRMELMGTKQSLGVLTLGRCAEQKSQCASKSFLK